MLLANGDIYIMEAVRRCMTRLKICNVIVWRKLIAKIPKEIDHTPLKTKWEQTVNKTTGMYLSFQKCRTMTLAEHRIHFGIDAIYTHPQIPTVREDCRKIPSGNERTNVPGIQTPVVYPSASM